MKRLFSLLLCLTIFALTLAACGAQDDGQKLLISEKSSRKEVTATFKSSDSDETSEVKMKKDSSSDKSAVFSCGGDTAKFDRVIINSDGSDSEELAYNDYVPAWDISTGRCYPGTEEYQPTYERVAFDYESRKKDVLIWTPEDYDKDSDEKYSVIYMTDGQNLFDRKATSTGSWGVADSVKSMMANGGEKCVIVGIENAPTWRDEELTPDIGEVLSTDYANGKGEYFSDFVVNTVMPYINENYNVYTDRDHTHVAGSSSGGIESFYIAMSHPDKFCSVGAFSPAFLLYSDSTWVEWLTKQDYSQNAPFIYLYCGNGKSDQLEQALCAGTKTMPDDLKKIGYPEDKVVLKLYDDGLHNEMYWRAIFPDYLKYAFPKAA